MKKVLILGGSYFVGRSIAEVMLDAGFEVYLLNRGSSVFDQRARQITADRSDDEAVRKALSGMDFDTVVDVSAVDPRWAEGLCSALDFSHVENFIYISSGSVYALDKLPIPVKETDLIGENPYWFDYGTNKYACEQVYSDHVKKFDTKLLILRPPYVYGRYNYVQRETFIFHCIENGCPVIVPKSNTLLQFLYGADLGTIVRDLPAKCGDKINIFNVGSSETVKASEWVGRCFEAFGKKPEIVFFDHEALGMGVRDYFPFRDYDYVLDVSKQNALVPAATSLSEGLEKTYEWYLSEKEKITFKPNVDINVHKILRVMGII